MTKILRLLLVLSLMATFAGCNSGEESAPDVERVIEYRDRPSAAVAGEFDVPLGRELQGILVYAEGTSHLAITDSAGKFVLSGLPVGEYRILAGRGDLATKEVGTIAITEADVKAAQPFRTFDAVMMAAGSAPSMLGALGSIEGSVVADDPASAAGAFVILGELRQGAITADDGSFAFPYVTPGTYILSVRKPGFADAMATVTVQPGAPVKVGPIRLVPGVGSSGAGEFAGDTAQGGRAVIGRVNLITADGSPAADYSAVRVVIEGTSYVATPASNGTYSIRGLAPRVYTVSAAAAGYVLDQKFTVDLQAVPTAEINLTLLEDAGDLTGISGLFGRVVRADQPDRGTPGAAVALLGTSNVTYTDDSGNYELIGVTEGVYTLVVTLNGYRDARVEDVEVFGDEPSEVVDVYLERDIDIPRVTFTDPSNGDRDVPIVQPLIVTVQFSVPMDVRSVREAVSFSPSVGFSVEPQGQAHGLAGTDLFTVSLEAIPGGSGAALKYGTRYRMTIASSAISAEGAAMEDPYVMAFTTGHAMIVSTTPDDGAKDVVALYTDPLRVFFNAPIDPDSVTADMIRIRPSINSVPQINIGRDPATGWSVLNIAGTFEFDEDYEVSIRRGIQTINGDRIRNLPFSFKFTTQKLRTYDELYRSGGDRRDEQQRERDR